MAWQILVANQSGYMFATLEFCRCFQITVSRSVGLFESQRKQDNRTNAHKVSWFRFITSLAMDNPCVRVASRSHFVEHITGYLVELKTVPVGAIVRAHPPPLDPVPPLPHSNQPLCSLAQSFDNNNNTSIASRGCLPPSLSCVGRSVLLGGLLAKVSLS